MSLILVVKEGRLAGKRVVVREGCVVTVGRAPDRVDFGVSHDNFMSSVHFAVEYGRERGFVKDRKSSNGTFLNGARITEAALSDGDEIRSGRTVFTVRIVSEEPQPSAIPPMGAPEPAAQSVEAIRPPLVEATGSAARDAIAEHIPRTSEPKSLAPALTAKPPVQVPAREPIAAAGPGVRPFVPPASLGPALTTIGSWSFAKVPDGWQAQGEFGIQRSEKDAFPSNVLVAEEMLGLPTLQRYVEAQVAMLRQYLREPRIEASLPPVIPGAEETVALDIRYATNDEQVICLRRIFARRARHVGVITLTTLEKDLDAIRPAVDVILTGVSFHPPE